MSVEDFLKGQEYQKLFSQLENISNLIQNASNKEDMKLTFRKTIEEIYPQIKSFEEKYNLDNSKSSELYEACAV